MKHTGYLFNGEVIVDDDPDKPKEPPTPPIRH